MGLVSYQSVIRGDYLTVFRSEFPFSEIASPQEGARPSPD